MPESVSRKPRVVRNYRIDPLPFALHYSDDFHSLNYIAFQQCLFIKQVKGKIHIHDSKITLLR